MRLSGLDHLGIAFAQRLPVVAQHEVRELAGQHLVAPHQHVEHGLRADDLARRRDQRRVARVARTLGTSARTSFIRRRRPAA